MLSGRPARYDALGTDYLPAGSDFLATSIVDVCSVDGDAISSVYRVGTWVKRGTDCMWLPLTLFHTCIREIVYKVRWCPEAGYRMIIDSIPNVE